MRQLRIISCYTFCMPSLSLGVGVVGLLLLFASFGLFSFAIVAGIVLAIFGIFFGLSGFRKKREQHQRALAGLGVNGAVLLLCLSALALHLVSLPQPL